MDCLLLLLAAFLIWYLLLRLRKVKAASKGTDELIKLTLGTEEMTVLELQDAISEKYHEHVAIGELQRSLVWLWVKRIVIFRRVEDEDTGEEDVLYRLNGRRKRSRLKDKKDTLASWLDRFRIPTFQPAH